MLVPDLGSGAGEPVSFLPLAMRGVARREGALSGLRRTARLLGRTRIAGSLAHMTRAPASLDAPRGIYHFRVHGQSDRPAVSSAAGRCPECRPGRRLMLSRPRRCRIPPHLHDASRRRPSMDGTHVTYGEFTQKSIAGAQLFCSRRMVPAWTPLCRSQTPCNHDRRGHELTSGGNSMLGRYQLAAVMILSLFAATKVANSAVTEPG